MFMQQGIAFSFVFILYLFWFSFLYPTILFFVFLDGEKDEPEPSNLSLSERIKMFNTKMSEQRLQKRESVVTRRRYSRFQTQPVTSEEVESAKCISPPPLG